MLIVSTHFISFGGETVKLYKCRYENYFIELWDDDGRPKYKKVSKKDALYLLLYLP